MQDTKSQGTPGDLLLLDSDSDESGPMMVCSKLHRWEVSNLVMKNSVVMIILEYTSGQWVMSGLWPLCLP
jgi:hypothetical protein